MKRRSFLGLGAAATLGFFSLTRMPTASEAVAATLAAPTPIQIVLENTRPLTHPRGDRLPFFVLPISGALRGLDDAATAGVINELAARGIGYTVPWSPAETEASAHEGLRIARQLQRVGLPVAVDATACLDGFFDGTPATLHVDDQGKPYPDLSFDPGRRMGCPLAVTPRIPAIRERLEQFLNLYAKAGIAPDLVFADWEIDGPLEWNDAWANSRRCQRCRAGIQHLEDFRQFQRQIRSIRCRLQREAFAEPLLRRHPQARVGNYAVHPHGGYRHWFDYFEKQDLAPGIPIVADQKARYREWAPEFSDCGFTLAMPVVYTWYSIFGWYDFTDTDYRWFYNGLRVGSDVGGQASPTTPILTFVHRNTTAPPAQPSPEVRPFSPDRYQELLWHLFLRGHDGLFVWCLPEELSEETRLAHQVYAAALEFREFLDHGKPVTFAVPSALGPVVSALRSGPRLLVRRTDFGARSVPPKVPLRVGSAVVEIAAKPGECQILTLPE